MKITEVKIKLAPRGGEKLLAFASVTIDQAFVVRDIKIIQSATGFFVAMPSRKITDRCPACGTKNHIQAVYCNQCGKRLANNRTRLDNRGRAKLHADIAHPINSRCRQELQLAILKGYHAEVERSQQPGYVPQALDEMDEGPEGNEDAPLGQEPPDRTEPPKAADTAVPPAPPPPPALTPPPPKKGKHEDGGGLGIFA